jgi:cadmium resistance protein CadD (predicted permease)
MGKDKSSIGKHRRAVGITIIWVALLYFFTEQKENVRLFLLLGLLPVIIGWTLFWVRKGYKKDESRKKAFWPWHR